MSSNRSSFASEVNLSFASTVHGPAEEEILDWTSLGKRLLTWRNLIKLVSLILYFVVGCAVYHHYEGWGIDKTISFTIVTMCTVGYGYRHPTSDPARVFTIFYLICGVYIMYFYVAKEISKRFAVALVNAINTTDPETLGKSLLKYRRLMLAYVFLLILIVILGALILTGIEPNWSFAEALYMAVQTTATVGYGDLPISHNNTYGFLSFFIVMSTIVSALTINNFQLLQAKKRNLERFEASLELQKDLSFLVPIAERGQSLSSAEFVLAVLQHTGRLDKEKDVDPWTAKFAQLKADERGQLREENVKNFIHQQSLEATQSLQLLEKYRTMPVLSALGFPNVKSGSETSSASGFHGQPKTAKSTELASLVQAKDEHDDHA